MKYKLYTALFFCFAGLASCGENEAGGPKIEATKPASLPMGTPASTPANTLPIPVNNNAASSTAKAKLNPAHGQPGHRCDVSVGAPLPGEAAQNVNPVSANSPVLSSPPVQTTPAIQTKPTTPVVTAAGLNPAHGQPGHRCDVGVGEPLSKGPAPASIKTATPNSSPVASPVQNTPVQNTPVLNAPVIQPQANPTVAAGLNPAHGQPGHRCDIAVGKPLNSSPKKD